MARKTETTTSAFELVRSTIDMSTASITDLLPKGYDVERFKRITLLAVQQTPQLMEATRKSFHKAMLEAATDGLLPDGREAAIVCYRDKRTQSLVAQYQPMVWGIVKLVRQSGLLLDLNAYVVREGDAFDFYVDENGPHFKHSPALGNSDAPINAAYAFARVTNGGCYVEVIDSVELMRFRTLSKSRSDDSPWGKWFDEMAKVRAIKRLCKRLPMSTDAIEALQRDNLRDIEHDGDSVPRANPLDAMNAIITGSPNPEVAGTGSTLDGDDDYKEA